MTDLVGYRRCVRCGNPVPEYVAWQTYGVCFDPCFLNGEMGAVREVEVVLRNQVATLTRKRTPRRKPKNYTEAGSQRNAARLRALRRIRALFPDIFDLLYADELNKAGLGPPISRVEGKLTQAVATYRRIATYHVAADRSRDGDAQEGR